MTQRKVRLDKDGVPIDPNDWTVEDWRTLHEGITMIKAIIAGRHRAEPAMPLFASSHEEEER